MPSPHSSAVAAETARRIAEAIHWTPPAVLFTGPKLNLDVEGRAKVTRERITLALAEQARPSP